MLKLEIIKIKKIYLAVYKYHLQFDGLMIYNLLKNG